MLQSRRLVGALVALCFLGLVSVPAGALPRTDGLTARVEADSYFGKTERPIVTVTLSNQGTVDLYVLRWQTPLRAIENNLFDVRRDGEPVEYVGPIVEYAWPTAADYLLIPAGGSRSVRIDLSRVYDLSRTGEYSIQYRVNLQDALRDATPLKAVPFSELASNVVLMAIDRDERGLEIVKQLRPITAAASNSFVKCDGSQQAALATARSDGGSYSAGSVSYLSGHTSGNAGPRYTTWFGALDSGRYATAKGNFNNISSTFQNAAMSFDCGCKKKNVYAFVYPNRPYEIHLCGAFWRAPATGTDSKAGTLVHETSHFTVVAGTNDWAYGQSACKSLAISDPAKAVNNADSHEYFAETTPAQN